MAEYMVRKGECNAVYGEEDGVEQRDAASSSHILYVLFLWTDWTTKDLP